MQYFHKHFESTGVSHADRHSAYVAVRVWSGAVSASSPRALLYIRAYQLRRRGLLAKSRNYLVSKVRDSWQCLVVDQYHRLDRGV